MRDPSRSAEPDPDIRPRPIPPMTLAVTGANSSVGLNLLGHAEARGVAVRACVRSDRAAARLPASTKATTHVASYLDVASLAEAIDGASCVVHLAGILLESRTSTYRSANVETTAAVVDACRKAGVRHVLLVSVIGADASSPNRYLRSKGEAERLVSDSGIAATILRTPILLGPGAAGAAALARAASAGRARLLGGGRYTMRPLDLDDLSEAILRACGRVPDGVALHELVGPEALTYRELVERAAERLGVAVRIGATPIWLAKVGAALTSRLRGGGISPTVIEVITADEVVARNADEDLGLDLTPLAHTLDKILKPGEPDT